jgi:hypothetical protein
VSDWIELIIIDLLLEIFIIVSKIKLETATFLISKQTDMHRYDTTFTIDKVLYNRLSNNFNVLTFAFGHFVAKLERMLLIAVSNPPTSNLFTVFTVIYCK